MNAASTPAKDGAPQPVLIAVVLSIYGWGLVEFMLVSCRAGIRAHVLAALYAIMFLFLSCRASWRCHGNVRGLARSLRFARRPLVLRDWITAAFLLIAGYTLGVLAGLKIPGLAVFAICLGFAPWMRLPFCRDFFFVACLLLWLGMGSATALEVDARNVIAIAFAAWIVWIAALAAIIGNAMRHATTMPRS